MTEQVIMGKKVSVRSFSFVNKHGGTGSSDWKWDERFTGKPSVTITKVFYDYECGWRFHAESADKKLDRYLDRNAGDDRRLFVSEFEIIDFEKNFDSEMPYPDEDF